MASAPARAEPPPAGAITIEGTVFLDHDGDGVLSAGDAPVADAQVAIGATRFTRADAAGRYAFELPAGDPALGATPLVPDLPPPGAIVWARAGRAAAPGPAWAPVPAAGAERTADIAVRPVDPAAAATPVTFVVAADTHVDGLGAPWTPGDLAAAVAQATALATPPRFFTIVGDVTQANRPEDFAAVDGALAGLDVPWVPVPGNHDWYDLGAAWRARWGPDAYSFDVGAVHVVVWNSSAPLDETLTFLRHDLAEVPSAETVIALGHAPPDDELARAMRGLGVDALFTGHWHANRVVDHDGLPELGTEPLVMGGIDLTPAGYRVVTIEADALALTHHAFVDAPLARLVWPDETRCHAAPRELLAAVEAGPGVTAVRATIAGRALALTRAGGWLWRARLDPLPEGAHAVEVVAAAGTREVGRVRAAISVCADAPVPAPALAGAAAAAWPQHQGGPEHAGAAPRAPALPLARAWVAAVGGHVHGGPIVADGRVFVPARDLAAGDGGGLVALALATGEELWRARTAAPVRASAAAAGGAVVFASDDGRVHAVEAATGVARWTVDLADGVDRTQAALWAPPTIRDGVVYVGIQRRMAALDLATGEAVWTDDPSPDGMWLGSASAVAVGDALVLGAFNRTAGLIAWGRDDGRVRWRLTSDAARALHAAPVIAGDRAYVGNVWGEAVAIDLATGAPAWTRPLVDAGHEWGYAITATAALGGGRLFVATQWDQVHALDAATGAILWSRAARVGPLRTAHYRGVQAGYQAAPLVAGDVVFVADTSGLVRALDAATGEERWRLDLGVPVLGALALAGDTLLVPTWDGAIHALRPAPAPAPRRAPPRPDGCAGADEVPAVEVVLALAVAVVVGRRRDRPVRGRSGAPGLRGA